ncbi:uncharacterized protein LOC125667137 isoform X1 [Ostrea edulis]|uniref:uncharacterized protein LOC125667137 isoform X1 n=1 Tax=Ostrea edulis TaxID=37623 RepID=UPI0024AFF889|nr:uncharacterized protein LOC125667137 isoform X1 [Ostrea edulis]
MYTAGLFMLLSLLMKSMCTDLTPEEPLCYDPKTPNIKRCCAGFRTLGGKCYPCIGSFGVECSKPCHEGYYGIQCEEKCQCNTCNKTTGECFKETTVSRMSSVHISILVFSFAGAVLVMALIIFSRVKRPCSTVTAHEFYLGESMPGADTSQSYTNIEQNIYNEIDTMHYLDPVDSIEKNNENIRQEKSEEKRDKRAREKSSLLSLLMRRSNNCQFDMTDRGYTDIIESDLSVNPPISTRTTRTMTTSEPPPRTNTKITTGPSTRLPGKGKRKTRPQTPPVIKEQTTTHPLLALTIRTPSPPGTNFKAKTITKPSSVAPKKATTFSVFNKTETDTATCNTSRKNKTSIGTCRTNII